MLTAVLGNNGFSKNLGKKGTSSDITLYNLKQGEKEITFIEPSLYPDKIQSLLTAVDMADSVILYISDSIMNFQLGEIILVLNYLKMEQGLLVFDNMVLEQIEPFIKGTVVEKYKTVENDPVKIKQELEDFKFSNKYKGNTALIDHSFQVKGVGNVFLGVVLSGKICQYDKPKIYPANKEVLIKSLQVHDVDVKEVLAGKRIGGSVKGCELDELKRGSILSDSEFSVGTEIDILFEKNNFFKDEIPSNLMAFIGMQYESCIFQDGRLKFEKDIVHSKGQTVLLCEPSKKMRIVGKGEIK